MGDVVSLTTQFESVGGMGTLAVLGDPSGRIVPVGISGDPGSSGGFVLPIVVGGLLDFSAEGFPVDVSDEPVRPGCSGETRSEEASGDVAVAGGSDRAVSEGVFGAGGAAGDSDSTRSKHSS